MRFARIVYVVAAVWGFLIITPLYFMFDLISRKDPPAITHPGFYYGFVGAAIAWQLAFAIIATDPLRFRPLMPATVVEKAAYGLSVLLLVRQGRMHSSDLPLAAADLVLGLLFIVSYARTAQRQP